MINKSMKIDVNGQSSEEVLKTLSEKIGQVKVIPDFGDKGGLETQDLSGDTDYDDLSEKIIDLRKKRGTERREFIIIDQTLISFSPSF